MLLRVFGFIYSFLHRAFFSYMTLFCVFGFFYFSGTFGKRKNNLRLNIGESQPVIFRVLNSCFNVAFTLELFLRLLVDQWFFFNCKMLGDRAGKLLVRLRFVFNWPCRNLDLFKVMFTFYNGKSPPLNHHWGEYVLRPSTLRKSRKIIKVIWGPFLGAFFG